MKWRAELEDPLHGVDGVRNRVALGLIEKLGGFVQQFVGQTVAERIEHRVWIFAASQPALRPFQFGEAPGFGVLTQLADGRHRIAAAQPVPEFFDLVADDEFGVVDGGLA